MSQRPKLKVLVEQLHSVKTKWRPIGIQLEVPTSSIKIIGSANKDDPEQAFTDLMDEWLKQTDPEPSWAAIVEALRSRSVGEVGLAKSVERNMCPKRADNPTPLANAELQQLEAVDAVLTDHLSLGPNHTPELQMVPSHEVKEVPLKVRNAIKILAKSLNRLRIDTYHHVVAIEVSVNEFRFVISNPERVWEEEDHKCIQLAESIVIIFTVISKKIYLNWQNYELLEEIIEAYGESKLKGKFESYCKDIEIFENETSLQDVKNIIFTPLCSNRLLMRVPIPNGISSPTLSLVRNVENGLKRNGYSHTMCCHSICKNSPLVIFFIIPRPFIPTTSMAKLSTSNPEKIEDRVIHTLSEEEVLQLLDLPVPPVQRDGMSPCDSLPSMNDPKNEVQIFTDEVLHTGSTTIICKAKFNRLPCAAKYVHQELTNSGSWHEDRFLKGCDFLRSCHHPNIVMFLCLHHNPAPVLLTELMDKSLHQFLERSQVAVPIHMQINICSDVADGLEYIHAKGYIYGDLNATNILLKGARAKIGGFMALHHKTTPSVERSFPPGCMPMGSFSRSDYDESIDCFSFGVLAIHIATRKAPSPISADHASEISASDTERFKATTEKVDPAHPIRPIILRCLEESRPSAAKLSTELSAMKELPEYVSSQILSENIPLKFDLMVIQIPDQYTIGLQTSATFPSLLSACLPPWPVSFPHWRDKIRKKTANANVKTTEKETSLREEKTASLKKENKGFTNTNDVNNNENYLLLLSF